MLWRTGATIAGSGPTDGLTVTNGGNSTGGGIRGIAFSGNLRVPGVLGENRHSTGQTVGVLGQATDSPIGTGVNGIGSITGAYFETTGGPSGGFDPTGVVTNVPGTNGRGAYLQGSAVGAIAVATSPFGTGLIAAAPASGQAINATGHVVQDRASGGFVKAMAYVSATGTVVRCFSALVTGVNCGISVSHPATGQYQVDFNFRVDDRFYFAQAIFGSDVRQFPASQNVLTVEASAGGSAINDDFVVFVF